MNTPLTFRFAAAAASVTIVLSILAGIGALAEAPVASSLFAQAAASTATIVR